jgi:hypothetical protein
MNASSLLDAMNCASTKAEQASFPCRIPIIFAFSIVAVWKDPPLKSN